ncbi:MAG: ribosome maturation factor RimP [Hyphomicrobiales bacterium]|nr:ribosome maturation factor RimP [Hyphomicrobiales bacterium]
MVEPQPLSPPHGLDEPRLIEDAGAALRIGRIAAPVLRDLGLRLVRVRISAAAGTTLQIMAERADGAMTIDDCERASDALSPVFDVENIMAQAYRLEISSPGIDRPLVRASDFERGIGFEVRVEMAFALDGRKRFRGRLLSVVHGADGPAARIRIAADDRSETEVDLPILAMSEARIVLTEDLVRAALRREKVAAKEASGPPPSADARGRANREGTRKVNRKAAARGAASEPLGPD